MYKTHKIVGCESIFREQDGFFFREQDGFKEPEGAVMVTGSLGIN
jgi:hypothetical protein